MIIFTDNQNPSIQSIQASANFIKAGEVIIHPTESLYGFGCLATNPYSLKLLQEIKGGVEKQRLLLIKKEWINEYVENAEQFGSLFELWPSPITMILPGKPQIFPPTIYNEKGYIGLRASSSNFVMYLLDNVGEPIASSSVNVAGEKSLVEPDEIIKKYSHNIPLLVLSGILKGPASTLIDCSNYPKIRLLREGLVTRDEIVAKLKGIEIL